jgi:GNAT superfamily N-acetyltransferase
MQNFDIRFVHLGYSHGQHDWIASASVDGTEAGHVTFAEYEGTPYVKMIFVAEEWRRNGIATCMLSELQRRYDGVEIDFGMATDDGAALLDSQPWIVVRNAARDANLEELARLEQIIVDYRRIWAEASQGGMSARDLALDQTKDWNQLSDAAEELARCIAAQHAEFRYINVDAALVRDDRCESLIG